MDPLVTERMLFSDGKSSSWDKFGPTQHPRNTVLGGMFSVTKLSVRSRTDESKVYIAACGTNGGEPKTAIYAQSHR